MADVSFNEEPQYTKSARPENNAPSSFARVLIQSGIVKTQRGAEYILLILAACAVIGAIILFSSATKAPPPPPPPSTIPVQAG